ncbi:GNAT family N-acetyltransferase [Pseudonocardia sp.]|uniref:GNAT family N-acetyltransferase n=1 Tax=Pseudonocardia sp. TaxID=60912 RepID=UPI003D09C206
MTASHSPLFLDVWLEYNRRRWKLRPERVSLGQAGGTPRLDAVLYRGRGGRIEQPPRNVYLPVAFETAPDTGAHRRYTQWTELASRLGEQMAADGVRNTINLVPEIGDIRPWTWHGLLAGVKYTFLQDLPYDLAQASQSVRSRIKKAQKAGYTCRRSDSVADVSACLTETQERSGFDFDFPMDQLDEAQRFVGTEHFRCYTAYAPSGEPAASYVVLHNPGGWALAWIISTRTKHLPSGATQQLHHYIAQDLTDAGAAGFDLVGAGAESISAAKAGWGPRLVPYYFLQQYGARRMGAYVYRGVQEMSGRFGATAALRRAARALPWQRETPTRPT